MTSKNRSQKATQLLPASLGTFFPFLSLFFLSEMFHFLLTFPFLSCKSRHTKSLLWAWVLSLYQTLPDISESQINKTRYHLSLLQGQSIILLPDIPVGSTLAFFGKIPSSRRWRLPLASFISSNLRAHFSPSYFFFCLFIYLFLKNCSKFKGYFPFTVITKYWLYAPHCVYSTSLSLSYTQ